MRVASLAVLLCLAALPQAARAQAQTIDRHLGRFFGAYNGCLVLYDMRNNQTVRVNPDQCRQRVSPCSTFKIYNSLVGLQEGVVHNELTTFKWDGTKYAIEAWNHDHNLQTAFRDSVVWYYQKVAEGIGEERMNRWMNDEPYGNRDISGGITKFWLGSTLQISPNEQVDFVTRLYRNQLKFGPEVMATVRKLMVQEDGGGTEFSGKTGSCGASDGKPEFGWFVGHLSAPKGEFAFAVEIEGKGASGKEARRIVLDILKERRLMQ